MGKYLRPRWILVFYLLLLLASHTVRRTRPADPVTAPGLKSLTLRAFDGATPVDGTVDLVYREYLPPADVSSFGSIPVVLLHGSPGSLQDFGALAQRLARQHRVLVPDLPGFGRSQSDIPDYSFHSHASYLHQMMDALDLDRAHIVAFSMGGGVALHLVDAHPRRVESIALVGSIGVQELELLGGYDVNHLIHRAQLAGLWLLLEAVPHFGALDRGIFGLGFARNFVDSDQRPLRGILEELDQPTLIVHGRHDPLVPHAAAKEHERIVPHSRLITYEEGDHFLLWNETDSLAADLQAFFGEVEAGAAETRAAAEGARLRRAAMAFDEIGVPPAAGLQLLLLVVLILLGTLLSEDLTCIATGLLIAQGRLDPVAGLLACFLGIYVGDLGLYFLGRWAGPGLFRRRPWKWFFHEGAVRGAAEWFERRGAAVAFLTRFVPGTRVPTYVAAGMVKASFVRFALWFLLAVAVWTPAIVGLSALAGKGRWPWPVLAAIGVAIWLLFTVGVPALTRSGRRALKARWSRLFRWEFWPLWFFYLPVFGWIAWLCLRYRSLTLVTAVNPGIPEGGFLGESKYAILSALEPAGSGIARTLRLDAALTLQEKHGRVVGFLAEQGLTFPVVLKPDVGQRGDGVRIVRSDADLWEVLETSSGTLLAQEFVAGPEFGIFYIRRPDQATGSIFSITEKVLPHVVGDGRSSLEELILQDGRAATIAETYFTSNADRLGSVPAAGERVGLVEIGTHCRGAIFLDGKRVRTPELEAAIDDISQRYEGFYFGRYDVRAPSEEGIRAGDFKVLELNGMTSEATHIYDPSYSLRAAYAVLFRQWEIAFEIAQANRDRGVRPASLSAIARSVIRYRRRGEEGVFHTGVSPGPFSSSEVEPEGHRPQ